MASYTFYPLPIVDSLNNHSGFELICWLVGIIVLIVSLNEDLRIEIGAKTFLLAAIVLGGTYYVSYHSGSIIVPKNEKVTANLVDNLAEGYNVTERHGKQTRHVDYHFLYVIYHVPGEGNIVFRANEGVAYPKTAVLYRN